MNNNSATEFFDNYTGWKCAEIPDKPTLSYNDVIKIMTAYSKQENEKLINFLLEIEAWLTFNQTPNAENTNALRSDIKKLLDINE